MISTCRSTISRTGDEADGCFDPDSGLPGTNLSRRYSFGPGYARYVFSLIQPYLKGRICELGSGGGELTELLTGYESVTAVEAEPARHLHALQRFGYSINIDCVCARYDHCPNPQVPRSAFDTLLAVDFLQYSSDDLFELEVMSDLLCRNGHAIVVVPAAPSLYAPLDRAMGYHRRYDRVYLQDLMEDAGFEVTDVRFFNGPGLLIGWLVRRLLRRKHISQQTLDRTDPAWSIIQTFDRLIPMPVGADLLMVGRRV